MKWHNWASTVTCHAEKKVAPSSVDELTQIILLARQEHKTLGIYGGSHSWSPLVPADYLISTEKLNRILFVDKIKNRVKVECGIKIYELNKALAKLDLALSNQAYAQVQSIGGAIATATHGSSMQHGTFSDFVCELEVIMPNGTVKIVEKKNSLEFQAFCSSLGSLGIVYAITLQCVPFFNVIHHRIVGDWQSLKTHMLSIAREHEYCMFFINPYTLKTMTYTACKTTKRPTTIKTWWQKTKQKLFLNKWLGSVWLKIIEYKPALTPAIIDFLFKQSAFKTSVGPLYDVMSAIKTSHDSPIYFEAEIAIPFDYIVHALEDVIILLKEYASRGTYIFPSGIVVRFSAPATQGLLNPALNRETAYISILLSSFNKEFFEDLENLLVKKYEGRPHWGKINNLDYQTAHILYGKKLDEFIKIKNSIDADGMFSNEYKNKLFKKS